MRPPHSPRVLSAVVTLCCALATIVSPSLARAQVAAGAGVIEGRVTDQTGAPLPGVSVTAASPALQRPQVVEVTNATGDYRFIDLPAGVYTLSFELAGFQTKIHSELRLTAGFVARINADLQVGGVAETVTVSGQGPLVDLTTTAGSTTFTKETLETIPTTRSHFQVLAMSPGVRQSGLENFGTSLASNQNYRNYGTLDQSTPQIEGINARLGAGQSQGFFDYATFEEARVVAVANDASVALPGVNLQVLVKSGGNDFHGSYAFGGSSDKLQSNNISDELRAQGVTGNSGLKYNTDLSGDVGGRIVRDKLWFYGAMRQQRTVAGRVGYAQAPGPDDTYGTADDVPGESVIRLTNKTVKLSYQLADQYKLIGFWSVANKREPEAGGSFSTPRESTANRNPPFSQSKGELQGALSNRLFFNALFGVSYYLVDFAAQPGSDVPGNPSRFDRTSGISRGPRVSQDTGNSYRWQTSATLNYLPANFLGGDHSFKLGYALFLEMSRRGYPSKPSGNYRLVYDRVNGVPRPAQIDTYNYPAGNGLSRETVPSVFLTDSWRVSERLTANIGLRVERYHSFLEAQSKEQGQFGSAGSFPKLDVITTNSVAPRIGLAYDLGDQRSVLKATYGLYNHAFWDTVDGFANYFNQNGVTTASYRWSDQDGNNDYTAGEVNLDVNGPDFISITAAANRILNPALKQPRTHEVSASIEREVSATLSAKALYVYKRQDGLIQEVNLLRPYSVYNIPITRRDPGPDGVLNTPDDAGPVTFYDYDPAFRGSNFVRTQFQNRPNSDSYNSVEFTMNKRRSSGWDMLAAYGATRNHRLSRDAPNSPDRVRGVPQSPNDEFFPLDETWDWYFKLVGSYALPRGITLSAFLQALSGAAGQRTYTFRSADPDGGRPIAQLNTVTLPLEPFGSRRNAIQSPLNFRAAKRWSLHGAQRLDLTAEVFNLLNASAPLSVSYVSGPSFGAISGILPPRIVRFGGTFSF